MTRQQRAGSVNVGLPWRGMFQPGDGQFKADDRAMAATMYPMFSGLVTSTTRIQLPVDCVMAGQQDLYKSGRVRGRMIGHVFGEK